MAECIHGIDDGLCDICFPRRAPEQVKAAPRRVTTPRASLRSSSVAPPPPKVTLDTFRVLHMTHVRNLEAILDAGELRAASPLEGQPASPEVDVSSATARELRQTIEAAGGAPVAAHVPFYLGPDAERWLELREGAAGSHWSDAARGSLATEYVVLAVPMGRIDGVQLADGDAAAPGTRFADGRDAVLSMLRRLHVSGLPAAEALAPHAVPFEHVALVGVANDPVRDRVRDMLRDAGSTTRVAVYPPWFQPVSEW